MKTRISLRYSMNDCRLPCTRLCKYDGNCENYDSASLTYFAHVVILENVLFYFDPTSEIEVTLAYYIHITFCEYRIHYIYLIHDTGYRYYKL